MRRHGVSARTERRESMAQHTPGPWHFDGADIDATHCGHKDGICRMLFTSDPEVNEQVKADARLIAAAPDLLDALEDRSEEHTSELQSLMRISYAVFCLKT